MSIENQHTKLLHAKAAYKIFIKLAPGVNFINVLQAGFAPIDPKSVKRYWQLDWILHLLGATREKAVCKYVGEIERLVAAMGYTKMLAKLASKFCKDFCNLGSRHKNIQFLWINFMVSQQCDNF